MSTRPEVLGIILARGGSKGIPKKNIISCAGKPLLWYTIEAAKRSKKLTRLIISTDSEEIADVARACGVEVPFLRPGELAEDHTLELPAIQHALSWHEAQEQYIPEAIVHLRPTTPLKSAEDIDRGIELLLNNPEAHSVRSICRPMHTPFKMYKLDETKSPFLEPLLTKDYPEVYEQHAEPYNMPRQELPPVWRHSGYVDVVRTSTIKAGSMSGQKILPLLFEEWRDIDIDTPRDLMYAEFVIEGLKKEGKITWE